MAAPAAAPAGETIPDAAIDPQAEVHKAEEGVAAAKAPFKAEQTPMPTTPPPAGKKYVWDATLKTGQGDWSLVQAGKVQASKLSLMSLHSEIYEDSFSEGQLDSTGAGLPNTPIAKEFSSAKEMLEYLAKNYGLSTDLNDYDTETPGELHTAKQVADHAEAQNGGWMEPTPEEVAAWKKGEGKLYDEEYYIKYSGDLKEAEEGPKDPASQDPTMGVTSSKGWAVLAKKKGLKFDADKYQPKEGSKKVFEKSADQGKKPGDIVDWAPGDEQAEVMNGWEFVKTAKVSELNEEEKATMDEAIDAGFILEEEVTPEMEVSLYKKGEDTHADIPDTGTVRKAAGDKSVEVTGKKVKAGEYPKQLPSGRWQDENGNSYATRKEAAKQQVHNFEMDPKADPESKEYKAEHKSKVADHLKK